MVALPDDLRTALDRAAARHPQQDLARAVTRLSARYREGRAATSPILTGAVDAVAYAAYRMPATYAAVHAALSEVAALTPELAPATLADIGGGTGTATWAAADVWPSLRELTVLEQVPQAITLGRELMAGAAAEAVRATTWRQARIDPATAPPGADVVTLSYVLGELPEAGRPEVLRWLAAGAGLLVVIEPGTPDGYARVRAAREELVGQGHGVVAPCPHSAACPITPGEDWCHFSARLPRLGAHRVIKEGTLNFEDEKFSYVAVSATPVRPAAGRVLRHPVKRKGLVSLRVCGDGGLAEVTVSKRHGADYKAARDVAWGQEWAPRGTP
ncbi:ribosomal protein RSM22 (predicted rRNA methylase) [Crossiella equi]|uniref:Ribosomal protein RSM22 (Predicted rRNA methylase) n=1 Tax=Crossiella equi TaxID=130796 RepID=A0ABS5A946_9PSEU|nr:small ribosomal subunit Rsm22 family protein [Crossiella equi]MBP2473113.1 ribosomal protein RSM22 (predicted rRNA methylase) [Crossiella equi]